MAAVLAVSATLSPVLARLIGLKFTVAGGLAVIKGGLGAVRSRRLFTAAPPGCDVRHSPRTPRAAECRRMAPKPAVNVRSNDLEATSPTRRSGL
jgi:hypothetical protein